MISFIRCCLSIIHTIPPGKFSRSSDSRIQCAFHVTNEGIAGVFARKMKVTHSFLQKRTALCDLARLRKRIRRPDPWIGWPVHKSSIDEIRLDVFVDSPKLRNIVFPFVWWVSSLRICVPRRPRRIRPLHARFLPAFRWSAMLAQQRHQRSYWGKGGPFSKTHS
jgi:hypothetical protein